MATRRGFLEWVLGGLFWLGLLFNPLVSLVKKVSAETTKFVVPRGTERRTLVDKNPANVDARDLEITPLKDFGTMGLEDHEVDLEQWRLKVEGQVKTPLSLTYREVLDLPALERAVLLICPGVFVNHGMWKGISMKDLLSRAGMDKNVTHVTFRGPTGRYEKVLRVPLEHILSDRVFLAYQVNGEKLPRKHGFPLRLVAEGYFGYDWVKYVDSITVDRIET